MLRKIITITCTLILVLTLTSCGNAKLLNSDVNIELGESIPQDLTDYVDISSLSKQDQKMILNDCSVSITAYAPVDNRDKDYPGVGEYSIEFTYEDTSFTTNIHVIDTTKPNFNKCESIEVMQGESLEYKNYVTATDLSLVEVTFNDESIDFDEVGEYKLVATATDEYKNKTKKEITVTVIDFE